MEVTKLLFKYLDTESVSIDKKEFRFQFKSHPDHPSLLALSDTLKFFNIDNAAFRIEKQQIDLLPNTFIAQLHKDNKNFLSFINKKENGFIYTNGRENRKASTDEFKSLWAEIVLLIESKADTVGPTTKNWFLRAMAFITIVLFSLIVVLNQPDIDVLVFYGLSAMGTFLTIMALKDVFVTQNSLLDRFCNASHNFNCNAITGSNKWKLFKVLSFSDLAIVFFISQFSALFLMGLANLGGDYFGIQKLLLLGSVPVVLASVYYQGLVEKKWCPICLMIIAVVMLQLSFMLFYTDYYIVHFGVKGISLYLANGFFIALSWFTLKNTLKQNNDLKAFELKANRFKRNYKIFKKLLLDGEHYVLPRAYLNFGNPKAKLHLSIITSPFCGHCEKPYIMLKDIEKKYGEKLQISVFYNISYSDYRLGSIASILAEKNLKNINDYYNAMDYWYEVKDGDIWLEHYQVKDDTLINDYSEIFAEHSKFFLNNSLNFTPCLFINGYRYPKEYKITELPFFIDELIEDFSEQ
jgi:hypothetical protein